MVANVFSKALALGLVPALTYLLAPSEYGLWGVASAWSSLTSLVLLFGLYAPLSRFYFDEASAPKRRRVLGSVFLFQLIAGAALVLTFSLAIAFFEVSPQVQNLRLAGWIGYFTSLNLVPLTLMRVREQAGRFALISILASLSTAVGPVVSLLVGSRTASTALAGLTYGSGLAAILYTWLLRNDISWRLSFGELRPLLPGSLQFVPHSLGAWTLNVSDRVIVQTLLGRGLAGVYTAGYVLASGVSLVIEGIGNSWFTMFLKTDREATNQAKIIGASTLFVIVSAASGLAAALFLPLVVRAALPAAYAGAGTITVLVALGLTLTAPYLVWVYAVMTSKRSTALPLITIAAAVTNSLLNVWMLPRLGIAAAAINTIICYGLQAALTGIISRRTHVISHEYRRWSVAIAIAFGIGLGSLAVPSLPLGIEILWRSVILAVTCLLSAFALFRHEDRTAFRAWVKR